MKLNHPITTKYELETVPIGIGGKRMEIYRVGNWAPLIERLFEDENSRFTNFPLWIKIWEAALVLTDYLLDGVLSSPQTVLEINAGMGITGMFLAAFDHHVTITDNQTDCLDLLRLNADHNKLRNLRIQPLDWQEPELTTPYDVICGAEAIYKESLIQPFIRLCRKYLKPDGVIYLAHDRQRMNMDKFINQLPKDMTLEAIGKTFTGKDKARRIMIHIVRFA